MSGMSNFVEDGMRTHLFRSGTLAKTTTRYVSLHTADPTDAGTGTEVSGGSYARVQRDADDANWTAASPTDGITTNSADITFPAPSASWGLISHVGIWDAITGGNLIGHGALTTPKTVNNGDAAPSFLAGSLSITFA